MDGSHSFDDARAARNDEDCRIEDAFVGAHELARKLFDARRYQSDHMRGLWLGDARRLHARLGEMLAELPAREEPPAAYGCACNPHTLRVMGGCVCHLDDDREPKEADE